MLARSGEIYDGNTRKSLIVSTEWLAQHLKEDSLVLLQVDKKDEYVAGHIPGARFITLEDISTPAAKDSRLSISNFSYLSDPSFVVMRKRFLGEFDKLWFCSLNGDSRETGKQTPEGKPDPSIFSTEYNREGIRVGTTIGLVARKITRNERPTVLFRQFWGVTKRADLRTSLKSLDVNADYDTVTPDKSNRFSFRLSDVTGQYKSWPKVEFRCPIVEPTSAEPRRPLLGRQPLFDHSNDGRKAS